MAIEMQQQDVFNRNQAMAHPPPIVQEKPNATNAIVPFNHDDEDKQIVPSFDLAQLINDVMKDPELPTSNAVVASNTNNSVVNNVPKSMFSNCSIGNITFNFQK